MKSHEPIPIDKLPNWRWGNASSHKRIRLRPSFLVESIIFSVICWIVLSLVPSEFALSPTLTVNVHTVLELFGVVIFSLLFAVCWYSPNQSPAIMTSAILLFGVAILDIFHLLSMVGMPDLITENTMQKSIALSLAAKYLAAFALFTLYITHLRRDIALPSKQVALSACIGICLIVGVFGTLYPEVMPTTYDAEKGMTVLKNGMEFLLVGIFVFISFAIASSMSTRHQSIFPDLLIAAILLAISSSIIAFFSKPNSLAEVFGHIYKIFAYWIVFQNLFVSTLQRPYQQLFRSEQSIKELTHIVTHFKDKELMESIGNFFYRITQANHILILAYDEATISTPKSLCYVEKGKPSKQMGTPFVDAALASRLDVRNIFYHGDPDGLSLHVPPDIPKSVLISYPIISESRGKVGSIIIANEYDIPDLEGLKEIILLASIRIANEIENAILVHETTRQKAKHARMLEGAREEERKLIARDIHDDLGGSFAALKIDISLLKRRLIKRNDEPELLTKIESMNSLVDKSISGMRRIINNLRLGILDDLGLAEAIEWTLKDLEERHGVKTHFFNDIAQSNFRIEEESDRVSLFRLINEALTNIIKHANASEATVQTYDHLDYIEIMIEDNGEGFDTDKGFKHSYGLIGMRERVEQLQGTLDIESKLGTGTTVRVKLPVNRSKK